VNWILTGISIELLGTLAASLGGATTLLYLLRVRRRRVQVPYSAVWRRVLQENKATQWWDRIKRLLSLLLQLLLLAMLLLALADPRRQGDVDEARSVVLLVDTSASMMATDEEGARSRMDRAREHALEALRGLTPRDELMLVRMDGQVQPLTPFGREPALVEELVRDLEPSATVADIGEAMQFAVDALAGRTRGEIILISDGAFRASDMAAFDVEVPSTVRTIHLPVGREGGNVGLTAFNVRRYPSNRTNYEVYAAVRSFVAEPVTVELSIYGEGRLVEMTRLDLAPGAEVTRIYTDLPSAGAHLEARIEIVAGDATDVFPVDDAAWTLLPRDTATRVLLVTDGNLYLEAPLLLNESIEVTRIAPAEYGVNPAVDPSAEYDVTIFDAVAPPTSDRGNFLYFAPSGSASPWPVEADVVDPIIHQTRGTHPLMRYIEGLRDVNIARARQLQTEPSDEVVASAIGGAPMIVARESLLGRRMAVAFRISDTDFALRVAFPVLLLNAIDWFTGEDARLVESYRTGENWVLRLDDRTLQEISVRWPSGEERTLPAYDGTAVLYGDEPGFYQITAGSTVFEVAGNLSDADESAIRPADPLVLGEVPISTELPDEGPTSDYDPWLLMVLAAFVLLMLEWMTWNRRITV
jgi:hypothetical protein